MLVAMGYYPGDEVLSVKLAAWIKTLGKNVGHHMLLARDVRCHLNNDASIRHDLGAVFDTVSTIDVPERMDGWPNSCNLVYRKVAKHIQYVMPQPWLWIEPDCVPLKEGWVEAIWKEYQSCGKPFLGDFVKVENVIPHCSGICVYPGKMTDYAGSAVMATDIAWDCYAADQIVPQMAQTHLIKHRWKHPPFKNQSEVDNLLGQLGDAVLFHADKSGTLIDFLKERRTAPKPKQAQSTGILSAGMGTVDIFIKTYSQDYEWLKWCLRSIDKFCSGFRETKVIFPAIGKDPMYGDFQLVKTKFKSLPQDEHGNDNYLSQQVFKLYADTFTDSDWILHTDSDTIFTCPITPETYLKNGKFVWMYTPMGQAHPNEAQAWRKVMHKFLGKEPEFEFMRRHPFLLPRWLYAELRAFCLKQHGVELKDYVMNQPYREFSEFNVLGFYAFEYHRDKFEWFCTSQHAENEWPVLTVDQQWSHNPIPVEKWEKILADGHGTQQNSADKCEAQRPESEPKLDPPTPFKMDEVKQAIIEALDGGGKHIRENARGHLPSSNNLTEHMEAIARHFTSPLAKGRIFKQLKAFPIVK